MITTHRVVNNIFWNLAGNALPLLVGVLAFPLLLHGLGVERFGLLSISWLLVGYFSVFDLGLSRAITHIVADRLGRGHPDAARGAASTALLLMWGLGGLAAVTVWVLSSWLVGSVLVIRIELRREADEAFRLLALSIPFVIHTAGLRGLLEAHHAFRIASVLRTFLGIGTYVGPLAVLPFGGNLVHVVGMLIGIRLASWFAHRRAIKKYMILEHGIRGFDRHWIRPLFAFGGWMTVTNLIGPLMVYLDRFLIGAVLSVAAVSYYVIPYEVVTRMWVVPAAIAGVLFPLFSAHWNEDSETAARYLQRSIFYVIIVLFPVFAIIVYLAPEILSFWLGERFAQASTQILRWLAAGSLTGSVAQMAFSLIQGTGRSDWTAKLHLAEAMPYWLLLLWLLDRYGVLGAAVAWFARTAVDALALIWLTGRLGPSFRGCVRLPTLLTIVTTGILLASLSLDGMVARSLWLVMSLLLFAMYTSERLISSDERAWFQRTVFAWRRRNVEQ